MTLQNIYKECAVDLQADDFVSDFVINPNLVISVIAISNPSGMIYLVMCMGGINYLIGEGQVERDYSKRWRRGMTKNERFEKALKGELRIPDNEFNEWMDWIGERNKKDSPKERINELADRLVKQPTQPEKPIQFPMDAIKGTIFEAYVKAFDGRSEVCPAYHFASLVNAFSGIAGGKILYSHDGEFTVKTNFYQCLLGIPSWSRKSSALDNSINLIESVLVDAPIVDALNTREGFIEGLDEDYPQAIIVLDELNSLLTKSKTRAGAGLIDMLNTAFNSKTLSNNSITNRVSVDDPTVSFFGAITPDLLELSLDNEGLGGGFMSRCVFYEWEKQPRIRAWGGYDKGIMEIVKRIVESAASMTGEIIYTWSEKALERSTDWYNNFAIDDDDDNANAVGRVPYYADKLAALMSFSENAQSDFKISLQTWKRVESIAEYWAEIYRRRITPSAYMTVDLKTEQRIRSFLSKRPNGASKTEFNQLRSVSTRDRNQILTAMVQSGEVHFDDTNRTFQLISTEK